MKLAPVEVSRTFVLEKLSIFGWFNFFNYKSKHFSFTDTKTNILDEYNWYISQENKKYRFQ